MRAISTPYTIHYNRIPPDSKFAYALSNALILASVACSLKPTLGPNVQGLPVQNVSPPLT